MIDSLKQMVFERAQELGISPVALTEIAVAKFSQRIARPSTKVLFLVSVRGIPVCVIKMMRAQRHNEELRQEASVQRALSEGDVGVVVPVLFDAEIGGWYVYAETYINGHTPSKHELQASLPHLIQAIARFPKEEEIDTNTLCSLYEQWGPKVDAQYDTHVQALRAQTTPMVRGITHSDLGRVNIICSANTLHIIDWERANQRPIWLIDAAYLIVRTLSVRTDAQWNDVGVPLLVAHTGCETAYARALYHHLRILDILRYKYSGRYADLIGKLKPTR